jgi:glycosyltransferase involved in cell wall biosynthesis
LPIYNKAEYLNRSIQSIQFQTLKNLEIITVNDCSEDNTLEVLLKLAKNDKRIKIINNKKNRGLLYSRAMGILNSKGEYLMNLDPDDELEGKDNLEYLYNVANKYKLDLISFGFIKKIGTKKGEEQAFCSNFQKIIYKPNIFISGSRNGDYLIWNKLVKKELFIKAYILFKEKIYFEKWNYGEDEIWSSLIYKNSNSMICVKKAIYIYHINNNSLMRNRYTILYMKNLLNWLEMFMKIYDNENTKLYLFNRLYFLISIIKRNKILFSIIKNNTDINTKYINIFNNISMKYKYNNSDFQNIIILLKI